MKWWHRWRYRVWLFKYYEFRGMIESVKEDGRWEWLRDSYKNQMEFAGKLAEFHFKAAGLAAQQEVSPSKNSAKE